MSYLDQQFNLQNAIANLPKEVGQAIGEIDITSEIWEICKIFGLLISETGNIYEETAKVITGETRPENFVENIHSKLTDDNKNRANEIAGEINNKILIPIRDAYTKVSMKNVPNYTQTTINEKQLTKNEGQQTTSDVTSYELPVKSAPETISHTDRDFLMYEIENPTPAGVSTVPYSQQTTNNKPQITKETGQGMAPVNLPTEVPKEIPIIRTMPRDMAQTTDNRQQVTYNQPNRGKFGQGTPPIIGRRPNQLSAETQNPKPEIQNNNENKNIQNPNSTSYKLPATNSSPTFIPSQPGMVGGTLRGSPISNDKLPITKRDERPITQNQNQPTPTPPTPKPQQQMAQTPTSQIPSAQNQFPNDTKNQEIKNEITSETTKTTNYQLPPVVEQSSLRGTATNESPRATPIPTPPKIEAVGDMVGDKLSNTVSMPSEKKRYVVDPYREPLE